MDEDPVIQASKRSTSRSFGSRRQQRAGSCSVLGETGIAQDPEGNRVERVAYPVHQDSERLAVAPTGLVDEVSIHLGLRCVAAGVAAINPSDGGKSPERSAEQTIRSERRFVPPRPRPTDVGTWAAGYPGRSLAPALEQDDVAPGALAVPTDASLDADPPETDPRVERRLSPLGLDPGDQRPDTPACSDAGTSRARSAAPIPWPRAAVAT